MVGDSAEPSPAEVSAERPGPTEPRMHRGCWITGGFLILLFATPCVVSYLWWQSVRGPSAEALRQARDTGDAHCMALWALVQEYQRAQGAFPVSLGDLRGAPKKPEFIHAVSTVVWGTGRYYRFEYSFDDPSALLGTKTISRRWTSKRRRWTEREH